MYDDHSKHAIAVVVLAFVMLTVLYAISSGCNICDIMQNPPDWIDSWYDGPAKEFFPEQETTE